MKGYSEFFEAYKKKSLYKSNFLNVIFIRVASDNIYYSHFVVLKILLLSVVQIYTWRSAWFLFFNWSCWLQPIWVNKMMINLSHNLWFSIGLNNKNGNNPSGLQSVGLQPNFYSTGSNLIECRSLFFTFLNHNEHKFWLIKVKIICL